MRIPKIFLIVMALATGRHAWGGPLLCVNSSHAGQHGDLVPAPLPPTVVSPQKSDENKASGPLQAYVTAGDLAFSEGIIQEKFTCPTLKRVIVNLSGKVQISTGKVEDGIQITVEGKKGNPKVFQTKNAQTVVVEEETGALFVCKVQVPPKVSVFVSSDSLDLDVDAFDGNLNVQAGVLTCKGTLLGSLKGAAGKMNVALTRMKGDCGLSCGEGDVQLCYDGLQKKCSPEKGKRMGVRVSIRQGKGVSCIRVPQGIGVNYRECSRVKSEISRATRGAQVKGFFYGPSGHKVILEHCKKSAPPAVTPPPQK